MPDILLGGLHSCRLVLMYCKGSFRIDCCSAIS
ncbi:MAG: hypothetical protein K6T78_08995 [Alicyclobacillus sp.]|nr:hypothetical protein [Alicyclobacillus sp.]